MGKITCESVVEMVVTEASDQFKPLWKINNESYNILKQYCQAIDTIADDFNGSAYDVTIGEYKMNVIITVTVDDLISERKSDAFRQLVERAVSVRFYPTDGNLNIQFEFPSIWEKA